MRLLVVVAEEDVTVALPAGQRVQLNSQAAPQTRKKRQVDDDAVFDIPSSK